MESRFHSRVVEMDVECVVVILQWKGVESLESQK